MGDGPADPRLSFLGKRGQTRRCARRGKQRLRRSRGDHYILAVLGQNDVAWEEEAYARFDSNGFVRELWIARTENEVGVDLRAELFLASSAGRFP